MLNMIFTFCKSSAQWTKSSGVYRKLLEIVTEQSISNHAETACFDLWNPVMHDPDSKNLWAICVPFKVGTWVMLEKDVTGEQDMRHELKLEREKLMKRDSINVVDYSVPEHALRLEYDIFIRQDSFREC